MSPGPAELNFCARCSAPLRQEVPAGDHRLRAVCTGCGTIAYLNPKIVAGCLVEWENHVLLCRRAIEPRHGLWTLPAGFMEMNESTAEAAERETREEADATVQMGPLYRLYNLPHIGQVYLIYRARLRAPVFGPTPESAEVRLFEEPEIPWDSLAFTAVRDTLESYFADRHSGTFTFRCADITPDGEPGRLRVIPYPPE